MTADIPGLLIGVDNDVREIGYKLYKWIGDPNRMQYPNAARFAKIPAEVFTVCKFIFFFLIHSSFVFSFYSSS
jgi:hypothetical protein